MSVTGWLVIIIAKQHLFVHVGTLWSRVHCRMGLRRYLNFPAQPKHLQIAPPRVDKQLGGPFRRSISAESQHSAHSKIMAFRIFRLGTKSLGAFFLERRNCLEHVSQTCGAYINTRAIFLENQPIYFYPIGFVIPYRITISQNIDIHIYRITLMEATKVCMCVCVCVWGMDNKSFWTFFK